jgi:hypothetical protein
VLGCDAEWNAEASSVSQLGVADLTPAAAGYLGHDEELAVRITFSRKVWNDGQ